MKIFGAVVVGLVAAALAGYILFFSAPTPASDTSTDNNVDKTFKPARVVPAGMREYNDGRYKFSILYHEILEVDVRDEGGGASTITFQSTQTGQGFQIFVVPIFDEQITNERFMRDVPTGVRTNVEDVVIDGATGAAFYSSDLVLGETREVWFVRDGLLYEVTTLRPLEAELLKILQTWQFI